MTVVGPGGRQLGRAATDETGGFAITVTAAGTATVILAAAGVDPVARTVSIGPDGLSDLGRIVLGSARRGALPDAGTGNAERDVHLRSPDNRLRSD